MFRMLEIVSRCDVVDVLRLGEEVSQVSNNKITKMSSFFFSIQLKEWFSSVIYFQVENKLNILNEKAE